MHHDIKRASAIFLITVAFATAQAGPVSAGVVSDDIKACKAALLEHASRFADFEQSDVKIRFKSTRGSKLRKMVFHMGQDEGWIRVECYLKRGVVIDLLNAERESVFMKSDGSEKE